MAEKTTPQKAPRRPVSLKWKVFLFFLGFCFLLLVILWLFQTVFLQSFYTVIKLLDVEKQARTLATLAEQQDFGAFSQAVKDRGDLHVVLWSEETGSQRIEGFFPEIGLPGLDEGQMAELYAQALDGGGAVSIRYPDGETPQLAPENILPQDTPDGQYLRPPRGGGFYRENEWVLHALVVQGTDTPSLLVVSAGITPINATVETLRVQMWVITVVMLALAVGIALLLARRVARPIEKLNTSAHQLGQGRYDTDFEAGGYREITELSDTLRAAALELSKTEALRRDLIANVSHDLRTPLTLITGYAEMMRDLPGETTPENMQVIIDEARRLTSLVADLLDLSRLQSGTSEMHIERVNLTDEIEAILRRFRKLSGAEGYDVRFDAEGEAYVQADAARISQVVYNFLINAMTHGGEEKSILVCQQVEYGRVRLSVIDRGEGIAPDQLPYIWDRYYKVDEPHKRAAAGAGLGLSIVKSILQQHPGVDYGVSSTLGQGSCFWFSLPVAE